MNGRIVDVHQGRYFEPGTRIVVANGVIQSVSGPREEGGPAPDYTVDLDGRAVLPGLFNTHCHVNGTSTTGIPGLRDLWLGYRHREAQKAWNLAECLSHGITTIRDAWSTDLGPNRALRERITRGEMAGPRLLQAVAVGPRGAYPGTLDADSLQRFFYAAVMGMRIVDQERANAGELLFPVDATVAQVRDAVDRAIDVCGAQTIKVFEQRENLLTMKPDRAIMSLDQLCALANQARRRGVPCTMHHVTVASFRRGVEAGLTSLAHLPLDGPLDAEDVEAFLASGCLLEPTLSVGWAMATKLGGDPCRDHPEMERLVSFRETQCTIADLADAYFVPELRRSLLGSADRLARGKVRAMGLLDMGKTYRYYARYVAHGFDNFRMLYKRGARMALGNDGGAPPLTPASLEIELAMFDHVLAPSGRPFRGADAVRIATIESARSLGVEDRLGSVETGKTADLVVLDGDPLEDFRVVGSRVAALFVDGRLVVDNCGLDPQPSRVV
ncbi:MAG: amidohydrolase family protein [Deltaproteobacteria bacterium]|nr:amidohydrolase family protein [Deltaproteobacteria bacterium]